MSNVDAMNAAELKRMVALLERVFTDYVTAVVRTLHSALVRLTPKETGWASWWEPGIGGPPALEVGRPTQERYPLPGADLVDDIMRDYELGDEVVLVSRAEYIHVLEAGHSTQRPDGFVEDAIDEARQMMDNYRFREAA